MSWLEDRRIKAAIIERYGIDQPAGGSEFFDWSDSVAEELKVTPARVRKAVLDYTQGYLNDVQSHAKSNAQRAADAIGATLVKALETISEGMTATKTRVLIVGKGDDARVERFEVPDWGSRLAASKQAVLIHGAEAPKQVEVNQKVLHAHLSDAEIFKQLQDLTRQLGNQIGGVGGNALAAAESASVDGGVGGEAVGEGLLLLDDGSHKDGRRAKRDRLQAVSTRGLHKKPRGRSKQ